MRGDNIMVTQGSRGRFTSDGESAPHRRIAAPPRLATVVPATTWSDSDDGLMFRAGAIEFGINTFWGLFTALGQIPRPDSTPTI